jgi:hypothetical protein
MAGTRRPTVGAASFADVHQDPIGGYLHDLHPDHLPVHELLMEDRMLLQEAGHALPLALRRLFLRLGLVLRVLHGIDLNGHRLSSRVQRP